MNSKKKQLITPSINLVPKDPFYASPLGKIMVWATKVGRYIIIFTEIVVILSFVSRFKLDRDLTDINASVENHQTIITSYANIEKKVRLLQKKNESVAKLLAEPQSSYLMGLVISKIPFDLELTQFSYTSTQMTLTGRALSSQGFSQFVSALQKEPRFLDISVTRITSGSSKDPGLNFSIGIKLLEEKTKKEALEVKETL